MLLISWRDGILANDKGNAAGCAAEGFRRKSRPRASLTRRLAKLYRVRRSHKTLQVRLSMHLRDMICGAADVDKEVRYHSPMSILTYEVVTFADATDYFLHVSARY